MVIGILMFGLSIFENYVKLQLKILDKIVRETVNEVSGNSINVKITAWKCLSPGYPIPTYRVI